MAASELLQAQHELASRVSNQFIASRLANAKQQDQDTSRANQQLQQTRLASSSPPGSQTTSKHSIQMPNQANNSEKQQQQRGDQFYQDSNHQHHNQWQLQPVKHEEDSDSSTASEQEADPRQDESGAGQSLADQNGKPHLGPMGIFFKVWSLVKVTKSRHTRMKQRQMSEAAAQQQFQYIPGGSDHHHQFGASGLGASQLAVTGSGGPTLSPLLALPHGSGQHQYPVQHSQQHQRHLLQDGHFRRAGSQPPLSSHTERRSFHLGPVGGAPPVVTNGAQNTSSTTGTTSSSSGVSSTTSSTLATNHTTLAPDGGGAPSVLQQNSRVHNSSETSAVSAHSSVRSTANQSSGRSWTARIKRGSGGVSQPPAHPPPAPIAISTTSGGGGHRPQRASLDKRQSMQLAASQPGSQSSAEAKRQLRAQSEVRQLEELRRKAIAIAKYSTPAALIGGTKSKMSLRRFRRRLRQDSVSDDGAEEEEDEDEEEEEEDDEEDDAAAGGDDEDELVQKSTTTTTAATTTTAVAARARRRQIAPEDEDDSDLNDIYSTPNDSIQSVPSGQLMLEPSGQRRVSSSGGPQTATAAANSTTVTTTTTSSYHQNKQRQTAATANGNNNCEPLDGRAKTPSQGLYQMTKSFSTSYFNQLSGDAAAGNKSKRGHEAVAPKLAAAGSTILETFDSSNNRNLNNNNTSSKRQSAIGTRSNGSRFFISSSSSEDSSNPPQQAQSAITLTSSNVLSGPQNGHRPSSQSPGRETCPTGAGASQHQHQQQISVQSGLHYHGPTKQLMAGGGVGAAISRPSSLAVSSPNAQLVLLQSGQPSILTPNTYIVNGSSVGMVNGFEPTVMTNVAAMSPMMCALPTTTTATTNLDGNLDIHQGVHSSNRLPSCQLISTNVIGSNYKKSPSLFNMNSGNMNSNVLPQDLVQRFSSKYPWARAGNTNQNNHNNQRQPLSSFVGGARLVQPSTRQIVTVNGSRSPTNGTTRKATTASQFSVPNSVSLHDCKLASAKFKDNGDRSSPTAPNKQQQQQQHLNDEQLPRDGPSNPSLYSHMAQDNNNSSEYKLAQMLLELGSNSAAKDETGCTALMYAIMSENLSAFKCVIEHGVDLNDTNHDGQSALDLICSKPANETLMEMLKLMIDNRVDLDRPRKDDGSRLLDRLIREHQMPDSDKILFIDCLLHNGAKLGSSTWSAARGKHEIQLKLLKKLCQDGYFLYKKSSIEAAVFRFEYALKRIDELEQQLVSRCRQSCLAKYHGPLLDLDQQQAIIKETQQARYQTFLGLSRCERKRGFFKRALEFADMSILIDSTSYEGYYSKAHILKDIGKKEDAILTIDQTERLVSKSIEVIKSELDQLDIQEESLVFDGCFNMHDPNKSSWIEATRMELNNNLDYLTEAKRHIVRLRGEIINDEQQ